MVSESLLSTVLAPAATFLALSNIYRKAPAMRQFLIVLAMLMVPVCSSAQITALNRETHRPAVADTTIARLKQAIKPSYTAWIISLIPRVKACMSDTAATMCLLM